MKAKFTVFILFCATLLFKPLISIAQQGFDIGINGGLVSTFVFDRSKLGDAAYTIKFKDGPAWGVSAGYNFTDMFGIGAEFDYVGMGDNFLIPRGNGTSYLERLELGYYQIPVVFKFSGGDFKKRFTAMIGPAFGILTSAKKYTDSSSAFTDVTSKFNVPDLGIFVSAGTDFTVYKDLSISLALRFYYGFKTINNDTKVIYSGYGENENLGNAYIGINLGLHYLIRPKGKTPKYE